MTNARIARMLYDLLPDRLMIVNFASMLYLANRGSYKLS